MGSWRGSAAKVDGMCELEFIDLPPDPDARWCDLGKSPAGFKGSIMLDGRDITERPAQPNSSIQMWVSDDVPHGAHLLVAKPTWEEMRANLVAIAAEHDRPQWPTPIVVSQQEYDELRAEHG